MVPCTSDTISYQKHVYYTAQLDEVCTKLFRHTYVFMNARYLGTAERRIRIDMGHVLAMLVNSQ